MRNRPWRLIIDPPRSGAENMARDAYCLAQAIESGRSILRFYRWAPATLSLGRGQKTAAGIDLAACREEGISVVRRMTGGRAVLHGTDLTYSVAAPSEGGRFTPGIMAVYREISGVFLRFFEQLGFAPEVKSYSGGERARMASPVCFSTPSAFEILVGGKKAVGSAQRLLPHGFLQHGSLPLQPQDAMLARVFTGVRPEDVRAQMTDLAAMGALAGAGPEEIARRLAGAFREVLGIELEEAPWRAGEEASIEALKGDYPELEAVLPGGSAGAGMAPAEPGV